jgi:alkylated DNA repair dioxygenase AlkB
VDVVWQESLFPMEERPRLSFDGLRRDELPEAAWIDLVPGWLPGHADLFDWLLAHGPWKQSTRTMWDKEVLTPRKTASFPEPFPAQIAELVEPLNARYDVAFDSCLVNLYRDGDDAVAWHGDTVRKVMVNPLVATISLGARRSFLVRSVDGGPVLKRYRPGEGDLLVMGGSMQHRYVHTVPRERSASGARMSVTLRHSRPSGASSPVSS